MWSGRDPLLHDFFIKYSNLLQISLISFLTDVIQELEEAIMSCPYFREGYFGICVAPDAVHVPNLEELESFCFRPWFRHCPSLASSGDVTGGKPILRQAGDPESAVKRTTSS
jgi:hypothetical protein